MSQGNSLRKDKTAYKTIWQTHKYNCLHGYEAKKGWISYALL